MHCQNVLITRRGDVFQSSRRASARRLLIVGSRTVFDDVQSVMEPYREPPLACRDSDPRAAEMARQVCGLISRHLPSARPEHVGSTSVPGCSGRGIIDLLVSGPESEMEKIPSLLARLGFQQGGEALFQQHPPPYRGTWMHNGEPYLVHAHVLPDGAAEIDSMRFLRSCLRSDGELMKAYVKQKRAILKAGADPAAYQQQKGEFLKMVLG
jgi:GrpB-like predicted nucleotidyltransferase (UPF0157 family)